MATVSGGSVRGVVHRCLRGLWWGYAMAPAGFVLPGHLALRDSSPSLLESHH